MLLAEQPKLIIIGGANGSGKTTLAREYIHEKNIPYLGADQIAAELNPADVESVALQAGRLFIQNIAESIKLKESFIVESTLSGLSLKKWLVKAREAGFILSISFVYLDSAELCIDRVRSRVSRGGHHVPAADILRRYTRANQNFWNVYAPISDEWRLYNNTGSGIIPVAVGDKSGTVESDKERFEIWLKMATEMAR